MNQFLPPVNNTHPDNYMLSSEGKWLQRNVLRPSLSVHHPTLIPFMRHYLDDYLAIVVLFRLAEAARFGLQTARSLGLPLALEFVPCKYEEQSDVLMIAFSENE